MTHRGSRQGTWAWFASRSRALAMNIDCRTKLLQRRTKMFCFWNVGLKQFGKIIQ